MFRICKVSHLWIKYLHCYIKINLKKTAFWMFIFLNIVLVSGKYHYLGSSLRWHYIYLLCWFVCTLTVNKGILKIKLKEVIVVFVIIFSFQPLIRALQREWNNTPDRILDDICFFWFEASHFYHLRLTAKTARVVSFW